MTLGFIGYAASYFKYKTPTPIRGEPTHKALKRLKTELQANASSVGSDLGGGDHGYLGIVLIDSEYAQVLGTIPFVAPIFLAALTIPATVTAVQALQLREEYKEDRGKYLESKNVEKALLCHLQDALGEKYLEVLVNEYNNLLEDEVPVVLEYLFQSYGKIRGDEVAAKELEVMSTAWHITDPPVVLRRPIEYLQKMATQAGISYTDEQILEKSLQLIRSTQDFETALIDWSKKPAPEKNGLILKHTSNRLRKI